MRGCFTAIGDVVINRIVEQDGILRNHANGLMQAVLGDITNIPPVDPHRAAGDVIEPEQKPADCRFAGSRGTHDCDGCPAGMSKLTCQDSPPGS